MALPRRGDRRRRLRRRSRRHRGRPPRRARGRGRGERASARPRPQPASLGDGRGRAQPRRLGGYVVGGTGGEQVEGYDWVTPFETATGCKVTSRSASTRPNMVQLMKTGEYDGVSASGDATLRLIAGGDVAPVNIDLIPNYTDVFAGLKNQSYNTVNGVGYGVPHGRGANVLMYNPTVVTTAPDSWSVVFDGGLAVQGQGHRLRLRDLHRRRGAVPDDDQARPRDHEPVRARRGRSSPRPSSCSRQQKGLIGKYWGTAQEEIDGFANGDMAIGTAWQYQAEHDQRSRRQEGRGVKPKEGATGWSDTWMISSKAEAPELHVQVDGLHHLAQGERRGDRLLR